MFILYIYIYIHLSLYSISCDERQMIYRDVLYITHVDQHPGECHRGLWCVFELAAFRKANPDGNLKETWV